MDQEHAKFVLATGFRHFWRGRAQKERMCVIIYFCTENTILSFKLFDRETFLGEGIFNRDDEVSCILQSCIHLLIPIHRSGRWSVHFTL